MNIKKILLTVLRWIPAGSIFAISWYLSNQETIEQMPSFWNADKLVHLVCFAGLSFWVAFGCNVKKYKWFWIPLCIVSAYGIIDEIHQSFTPGRSSSVFDWMADTIGAALGAVIYISIFILITKKKTENN